MRLFDLIVNLRDEVIAFDAELASKLSTALDLLHADDWIGCRILLELIAKRGDDDVKYLLSPITTAARNYLLV